MSQFRREFAPGWVRTEVTMKERVEVWELVACGHNIARVQKELELRGIYFDRRTISRIIQEAIGEPGIPAELVRTQKPAVQEWIISKRPHIREALSGAPAGGGVEPTKPTARTPVVPVAKGPQLAGPAARGPTRHRWLMLAGIVSAIIALCVLGIYLWPSPRPEPTTAPTAAPAAFLQHTIVTVAGSSIPAFDGGPATAAYLGAPRAVALDSENVYILDGASHRVRRVDLATGIISTFAGTGTAGFSGDGGPATAAQINAPDTLALDSGYLYIADTANNRVRRVDLATGTITTFAGTGVAGFAGDGGTAAAAQLNSPFGLALDSRNLYISGDNRVRRVDLATGIITTLAGTGMAGFSGDGGPGAAAQLNRPFGLAIGSGNLYIAESVGHRVRKVDLATGIITTFAGTGMAGFSGDGGPATAAQLNYLRGVAFDSGNLYIGDSSNHRIRRVDLATGIITTFAGTGKTGSGGDGGPAIAAQFYTPYCIAVGSGSLYVAEFYGNVVRRIDLASGTITTFAGGATLPTGDGGPATAAQLTLTVGVAVGSGNLYIADQNANRIRRVDLATGIITTFAGTGTASSAGDGGPAISAQLSGPRHLAIASGSLYIAENAGNQVRRVDLATGTITTVAGTGVAGFSGDGSPATAAQLSAPQQLAVGSGSLYIADTSNNRVRRVDLATGTITTFAGTGTSGFSGDGGPATAAQLSYPVGLAIGSGNLYISDQNNYRVRKVDLVTGIITTAVGTGVRGYSGDGGPATAAQLYGPNAVALDSANLYISDAFNNRVRRVSLR